MKKSVASLCLLLVSLLSLSGLLSGLLSGCMDEPPVANEVSVSFAGVVGDQPFACDGSYSGIGTSSSELTTLDFRLYVSEVELITADGEAYPLELTEDGTWQRAGVALLDFEDGSGGCASGTPAMHTALQGTVAHEGPFTGVRFVLGVPEALNHDDASTAEPPLSTTTMFWNWNGGYKFLRIDARSSGQPEGLQIHLGSSGCMGDGRGNVESCTQENRSAVELSGNDPTQQPIYVDIAGILSGTDIDTDAGGAPGCMAGLDDPECGPIFERLGLPFNGAPAGQQQLFRW